MISSLTGTRMQCDIEKKHEDENYKLRAGIFGGVSGHNKKKEVFHNKQLISK